MKIFFLIGLFFISGFSKAHLRSRSYSAWNFEGSKVKVFLTVSARFVTKIPLIDPLENEHTVRHRSPDDQKSLPASLFDPLQPLHRPPPAQNGCAPPQELPLGVDSARE